MKRIVVQIWDRGDEYSELIQRVLINEEELEKFIKVVNKKLGYSVEIEYKAVIAEQWLEDILNKRKRESRNSRRRYAYWAKKHPEEAKERERIMETYLKLSGIPEPILPKLFAKASKNQGIIKFRRYKKSDAR